MTEPWIRGSASGFMWGRTVFTKYSGACLRSILIKNKSGIQNDIDPSHQVRGAYNEDEYEKHLIKQGTVYEREVEVVVGPFSGHIDFWVEDRQVVELKSSQSKSRKSDIKKGEYVVENLAQAVAYMVAKKTVHGKLIYSFWSQDESTKELKYEFNYVHTIFLDDFGRICLDNVATRWTVYDLLAHQHYALKVQAEDIVWDRPHNHDLLWGSPCTYCPFAKACDAYDTGEITTVDQLISMATSGAVSLANSVQTTSEEVIDE